MTGGNGGLGQRIAHALAKEGVQLALVYAKSKADAERVAGEVSRGYNVQAAACSTRD